MTEWLKQQYNNIKSKITQELSDDDAEYLRADEKFKLIKESVDNSLLSLSKLIENVKRLSDLTAKFGSECSSLFVDAQEPAKNEAKSIEIFGERFKILTSDFLISRVDDSVRYPVINVQRQIERLEDVKAQRKKSKAKVDKLKYEYDVAVNKGNQKDSFDKKAKYDLEFSRYSELNNEFISCVNQIVNDKSSFIDTSFINLSGVLYHFMSQVANEMEGLRAVFPQEVFAPRVNVAPVGSG